jgi:membrane protease YdiL (CAAX protease family)
MKNLGSDLSQISAPWLYSSKYSAGLWTGVALTVVLVLANALLQMLAGMSVLTFLLKSGFDDPKEVVKAFIIGIFPASVLTAMVVWYVAKIRGGKPREILSLRWPKLSLLGWICVIGAFLLTMYAIIYSIVAIFHIDMAQYTPGPNGESPSTGSAGMVKEAMFDLANEPTLYWLAFPAITLGAPVAEEFIFRGFLFSVLANSRAGLSGATLITAALWSLMHVTEPWFAVGVIFLMGLVLGCLLIRFGSLWVTMACHAIWNASYALLIFGMQPQ